MRKTITYPGDCAAPYDQAGGTGIVGKVLGPPWYRVASATYDPATDTTRAILDRLVDPARRLDEMTGRA